MKADMTITKMIDGTYKAWKKRSILEIREYIGIVEADGKTVLEAEKNLRNKLGEMARKELRLKKEYKI